jgi:acetoin utilization protein AcuB
MNPQHPSISHYMTPSPWTVRAGAQLSEARELMRAHDIRHLPVLEGGKVVGLLSQRDVYVLERYAQFGTGLTVEDAMTQDVYSVGLDEPVAAVVRQMAEHRYGSALVIGPRDKIEGIFTTVDAMRLLARTLVPAG